MATEDRGFASMDRVKQREIASRGGKAAHEKGTAHEWTSEEARAAGRRGGLAGPRRRAEMGDERSVAMGALLGSPNLAGRSGGDDHSAI